MQCPRITLAGFTPVLVWLAARLLVSCCQWLVSDNFLDPSRGLARHSRAQNHSLRDASNTSFQLDPIKIGTGDQQTKVKNLSRDLLLTWNAFERNLPAAAGVRILQFLIECNRVKQRKVRSSNTQHFGETRKKGPEKTRSKNPDPKNKTHPEKTSPETHTFYFVRSLRRQSRVTVAISSRICKHLREQKTTALQRNMVLTWWLKANVQRNFYFEGPKLLQKITFKLQCHANIANKITERETTTRLLLKDAAGAEPVREPSQRKSQRKRV